MKKLHLLIACIVIVFTFFNTNAQRGIGTNTPNGAAILELKSTTKGFLPPRLSITEIESILSPPEGLIFYCTDCRVKGLFFFNGHSYIGFVNGRGLNAVRDASIHWLEQIGLEAGSGSSEITIAHLNAIFPSLSNVEASFESFYRTHIGENADLFGSPATQEEVETAIDFVNNAMEGSSLVLEQIGSDADAGSSSITIADLNAIFPSLGNVEASFESSYRTHISKNADLFGSPATQEEVQTAIDFVNSSLVLEQIGLEAGSGSSSITIADLNTIFPSLSNVEASYESFYRTHIGKNADLFGSPATQEEVQTAIDFVNSPLVLEQIGLEAGSGSSNITIAQLDVILPSLTDVKYGNQSFYRVYIGSNPNEFASPATKKEVQNAITHVNGNLNIPTVSGQKGTVWMDRNLGATQVATSSTDHLSYGNLYQWGRRPDGHEVIVWTSSTGSDGAEQSNEIGTQSSSSTPVHDDFITSTLDWTTSTATLWQVVNGENNPCPTGFRIPTSTELDNERAVFSTQDYNGAFNSVLKLPVAGFRSYRGSLFYVGSRGRYWSSAVSGTTVSYLDFYSSNAHMNSNYRASGFSVRCIKQ